MKPIGIQADQMADQMVKNSLVLQLHKRTWDGVGIACSVLVTGLLLALGSESPIALWAAEVRDLRKGKQREAPLEETLAVFKS
ncbi:hypothetical protein N7447_010125 [Penicillium robsamsonii]|uniref:uncharacterized protein n=1 Tax=Penicillium robsamsonii TaxID=1792511 RepID=UPI0025477719|nr:uncharacterized protein N7447_010125 [Penicillium robsamsonii]KAJ5813102.1 hypothetical protein N7447_010125 [Penicillium robsamsonii]